MQTITRTRIPILVMLAVVALSGCGNPADSQSHYPDFDDPYWRDAHEIVVEVMERFVRSGDVTARSAIREWPDGSLSDDYTDIEPATPEAWAALEQEVLAALAREIPAGDFEYILGQVASDYGHAQSRDIIDETAFTYVGQTQMYVTLNTRCQSKLLFWHAYMVEWDIVGADTPDSTAIAYAVDNNTGQTITWNAWPTDTTAPTFYDARQSSPDPMWSKWYAGARAQFFGYSQFRMIFTDSLINGGMWIWEPDLGLLSK